jgi:N-acetylglucosaminyldiphosphoundecaprenol N-acetyl-beta-D-mannosaminyltransferase
VINILNIDILSISLSKLLKKMNKGVLVTPNLDHLILLQKDQEFYNIYKNSDWVVCDSKILNLGARFLGESFKEVIPGSSLFSAYYNYHRKNDKIKIFLLGAAEGVAIKAMEKINAKVGRDIIVGAHSPSFGFEQNELECDTIVKLINNSEATVLVVGVGAPKQEKWIFKYKSQLKGVDLFMPLGATIDFEAGNVKRAPKIFQEFGFEWLYRLYKEPKRLWKRYLIDDMPFFYLIIRQKLGLYNDPFHNKE